MGIKPLYSLNSTGVDEVNISILIYYYNIIFILFKKDSLSLVEWAILSLIKWSIEWSSNILLITSI